MIRESKNEKILKACLRAEFALKQRIERIKWESDELMPRVNDFLGRAQIPNAPDESIIEVVLTPASGAAKVKRAHRRKA